jgi:hypothetical protein
MNNREYMKNKIIMLERHGAGCHNYNAPDMYL